MRVKIKEYDPATGKGFYTTKDGARVAFKYKAFKGLRMIPAGRSAELIDGVLHPVETLRDKVKALFRRILSWR